MSRTRRRREIAAPPERLWAVVADPHHLPRWWPGAERVEDASPEEWTLVLRSGRGKAVRADFTMVESDPPERLCWRQELEATPFERFLAESVTEIRLARTGPALCALPTRAAVPGKSTGRHPLWTTWTL